SFSLFEALIAMVSKWLPLAFLLAAGCSGPAVVPPGRPAPGETRTFEGTWSASGSRRTLELDRGHKASILSLTGSRLLTGQRARGRPQGTRDLAGRGSAPLVTAPGSNRRALLGRPATFALALGLWFTPIPSGLTSQAWHLFAIFAAAIFSVIVAAFPLLTAAMLAAAAAVLTGTIAPAKAFAGFANG